MKKAATLGLVLALVAGPMFADEGAVPEGIPHLDHVFVIMMENHAYGQIVGNPNAPFTNSYLKSANTANNYFAIGHPSLTNYLEIVGGSNFGAQNDNSPDWHNTSCITNLSSGVASTDVPPSPDICPISGTGTDAATPVFDCTNEPTPPACLTNNLSMLQRVHPPHISFLAVQHRWTLAADKLEQCIGSKQGHRIEIY